MSIEKDNVLDIPEGERYIRYCVAIKAHRDAGFAITKEENERIAALFNVTPGALPEEPAPKPRESPVSFPSNQSRVRKF